jgi:hypothetical protein
MDITVIIILTFKTYKNEKLALLFFKTKVGKTEMPFIPKDCAKYVIGCSDYTFPLS